MKINYSYFKKLLSGGLFLVIYILMTACEAPLNPESTLTIGFVETQRYPKQNYEQLKVYMESELRKEYGDAVQVKLDSLPVASIKEVEEKIKSKKWDIAFTFNPMYSIIAKDNNYEFAARMFPEQTNGYFNIVFFVKSNSPIKDVKDIQSGSTIALGGDSAPLFVLPLYDLYGKDVRITKGNTAKNIIDKVRSGEADIGVGITEVVIKQEKDLRVLKTSRVIPVAGVYIFRGIEKPEDREFIKNGIEKPEDREFIKKTLDNAPQDIKDKSNFTTAGQELKYENLKKIADRVNEITKCVDWNVTLVKVYCLQGQSSSTPSPVIIHNSLGRIDGVVNGVELNTWGGVIKLNLQGDQNKVYRVIVSTSLLQQIPTAPQQKQLSRKRIRVTNVDPTTGTGGIEELQITKPEQLTFFDN
ncbi:phosphate/phosphite/phosphonate ABC transporter substrate-binding protein [Trichormus variabilis]|uniref:Uncharacterized protein n=1 Tax=Trichormus variabilis SAG 1403-4b TaxID=447716 RepID=A0A3S1IKT3_ANAVA|nr:PhnD/SsuA/transferrin family substrate-binding protein [Trichormus variabilis]MBD2625583.1 PhnD/SsuA/transferrin family substrate-binding protein [Trichormus variabilis FACHB-164]RUS98865.1 hypothetical protein DSM107003_08840 [Trichormus variabilis SAG 1403-4b]